MNTTLTDRLVAFIESHGERVSCVKGDTLWVLTVCTQIDMNDRSAPGWHCDYSEAIPATFKAVRKWLGY